MLFFFKNFCGDKFGTCMHITVGGSLKPFIGFFIKGIDISKSSATEKVILNIFYYVLYFPFTFRVTFTTENSFKSYFVYKLTKTVRDRKSTRLNSSHVKISYAVFCLKKKKHKRH